MSGALVATWWGHATTTVELGGVRVLLDPVLTTRLAHLRRATPAPPADAARADLVLVSHQHLDHLHVPSLTRLAPGTVVVVPAGAEDLLTGVRHLAVRTARPGDALEPLPGVRVSVLPATHDGRRHALGRRRAPALGFRVGAGAGEAAASFWYPGDTGLRDDFRDVAPVDLALVPAGGWGPSLGPEHLEPEEAAEAVARVGARRAVPVHWGTFWPVGLRVAGASGVLGTRGRGLHEHFFTTPGRRFAEAVARLAPATEAVVLAPGGRTRLEDAA